LNRNIWGVGNAGSQLNSLRTRNGRFAATDKRKLQELRFVRYYKIPLLHKIENGREPSVPRGKNNHSLFFIRSEAQFARQHIFRSQISISISFSIHVCCKNKNK
jgi:hypothetical protein